ncbi:MAG: hypothetical protein IPP71_13170 [Bacteroidetes bacterium]|nr:hypothetical protein [Bacteroidota bacterium]
MKNTPLAVLAAFAISITLFSCGGNKEAPENSSDATAVQDTTPLDEVANFHFSYTIANLPSPIVIFDEFTKSGLPVDANLLNPSGNVKNYTTTMKQAFNYGIYGVDLAYLVINERNTDIYNYYNASKDLANALNLGETFKKFVDRFEANSENRDSLTRVIDEAYGATDSYLRSNERLETASQILAGSWLECQFITVELLKKVDRNAANEICFKEFGSNVFTWITLLKFWVNLQDLMKWLRLRMTLIVY